MLAKTLNKTLFKANKTKICSIEMTCPEKS